MKEEQNNSVPKSGQVTGKAKGLFEWWNNKATILENDTTGVKVKKIGIRVGGILLMIIFSPILLAIFITVMAVTL